MQSMPADHFIRANFPVLSQLCRHIVVAGQIAQMLKNDMQSKNFNYRDYAKLLRQQTAESRKQKAESLSIMRLSRSLRLTQQSTFNSKMRLPKGGATIDNPRDREE